MTIGKKLKQCITLSVYSKDIMAMNQAIDKFLETRARVYISVQGYTNLLKKMSEEKVLEKKAVEEDAFIFFDVTKGESCITIENSDREVAIHVNENQIEEFCEVLKTSLAHTKCLYKGLITIYIDKKQYALLLFNAKNKQTKCWDNDEVKAIIKTEIKRVLEGVVEE